MAHLGKAVAVLLGAFVLGAVATESSAAQIGTAGIMNNAITTPKIKNLAVTNAKIGNLAVTSAKIANEAVTPRKISYNRNVIVVAPTGGDFTSPVAALASITDASESNPYLVKLMPGGYDIGGGSVIMKSYVDLEGSGELVTTIRGTVSTPFSGTPGDQRPLYGVVTIANDSELRDLTVINSGAGTGTGEDAKCVTAILSRNTYGQLSSVRAGAMGTNCNIGILIETTVVGEDDTVWLRNVYGIAQGGVTAIGIGVRGSGSGAERTAFLTACIAEAGGASSNNFALNVSMAAPIVQGGVLIAYGGTLALALRGDYGLPNLQGVLMGASDLRGNLGAAAFNQCTMGPVSMTDGDLDIFSSSVQGPVTVNWSGGGAHVPVVRCAGTVRTDATLATLNADCSTP